MYIFDCLQAPDTFIAAAARNPVCNLSLMVGTTDIPDWCFVEVYGKEGKKYYSESPSVDDLRQFHQKSPISHISKVQSDYAFFIQEQFLKSFSSKKGRICTFKGRYSGNVMKNQLLDKFSILQVKTPTLFLLGAQDLRVPVSNGLQVF